MDEAAPRRIAILAAQMNHEASAVAALTWMVWDATVHLGDELQYVWSGPASWVKWMYAFIRYAPIVHGGVVLHHYHTKGNPPARCRAYIAWELSFLEILTVAVEIVLMVRVFILYSQNRKLKAAILAAFAAEVVGMLIFISFAIQGQTFTDDCLAAVSPGLFMGYWSTALAFELFLFVLTLASCTSGGFRHSGMIAPRHSILFVFLRDGTWAFALIFVATLANLLLYELDDTPRSGSGYFWELGVLSFAGSHIILNIRRRASATYTPQADISTPLAWNNPRSDDDLLGAIPQNASRSDQET